jgi:hypothetical protein
MKLPQFVTYNQETPLDDFFLVESLEDQMKVELLSVAFEKFTLTELEEKLGGNRFNLEIF